MTLPPRLAVVVVMDGVEDEGGQHGQAVRIAVEMARLGHRVCYLSRWPVSRRRERYGLDVGAAPRLDVDAYTTDSPDSAGELEAIEQRPVTVIPCIAGFGEPASAVPDLARRFAIANRLVDYKRTDVAVRAAA